MNSIVRWRPRSTSPDRKVDLSSEIGGIFGQHRCGWPYVLRLLNTLHQPGAVTLDSFIERTFCWHPDGPRSHTRPWIGFIHVPPRVPDWFQSEQSNDALFAGRYWQESLPLCRGLFTLSRYHRTALEQRLSLPINDLFFPTEPAEITWRWDRFCANTEKKVVQVGWWLRRLHAIYKLPTRTYRKVFLRITHADIESLLKKEREVLLAEGLFQDSLYDSAITVGFLPDREYDQLLSENLVLVHLYDSSANNTVIDCLARHTPLLINPVPAVVEYLGVDYPFYFETLEEAAAKAEDLALVRRTHEYLRDSPAHEKLRGEYFLRSFTESSIYKAL